MGGFHPEIENRLVRTDSEKLKSKIVRWLHGSTENRIAGLIPKEPVSNLYQYYDESNFYVDTSLQEKRCVCIYTLIYR